MFYIQAKTDLIKIDPNEPELLLFEAFIPLHTIADWRYADEDLHSHLETSTVGSLHSSLALTPERTCRLILCDRATGPIEISCLLTRESELCVAVPARTQSLVHTVLTLME